MECRSCASLLKTRLSAQIHWRRFRGTVLLELEDVAFFVNGLPVFVGVTGLKLHRLIANRAERKRYTFGDGGSAPVQTTGHPVHSGTTRHGAQHTSPPRSLSRGLCLEQQHDCGQSSMTC